MALMLPSPTNSHVHSSGDRGLEIRSPIGRTAWCEDAASAEKTSHRTALRLP